MTLTGDDIIKILTLLSVLIPILSTIGAWIGGKPGRDKAMQLSKLAAEAAQIASNTTADLRREIERVNRDNARLTAAQAAERKELDEVKREFAIFRQQHEFESANYAAYMNRMYLRGSEVEEFRIGKLTPDAAALLSKGRIRTFG